MDIIFGLVMMGIGAFITIYSEKIFNTFGRIEFFEKYLGTEGGSRLGYKLFGILVFFIGTLILTGMIQDFIMWILSPILAPALRNM